MIQPLNRMRQNEKSRHKNRPCKRANDEGPRLETLDYAIRIGSAPTFLYFDLFLFPSLVLWA